MGVALVAMAEDLGSAMAARALEHLLQYGEPAVRWAIPLDMMACLRWLPGTVLCMRLCAFFARTAPPPVLYIDHSQRCPCGHFFQARCSTGPGHLERKQSDYGHYGRVEPPESR
jgi:hypothetical protein